MAIISKTEITHVFDYEGNNEKDRKVFTNVLDKMCKAEKQGKNIIYNLNITLNTIGKNIVTIPRIIIMIALEYLS